MNEREITIPTSEHPRVLSLPVFPVPSVLLGKRATARKDFGFWTYIKDEDIEQFQKKYGGTPTVAKVHPLFFARMIAKIAHAYVAADPKGIGPFRPLLLDLINGRSDDIHSVVGCESTLKPPEPLNYVLGASVYTQSKEEGDSTYIIATVRLFAEFGAPTYLAVVGERLS